MEQGRYAGKLSSYGKSATASAGNCPDPDRGSAAATRCGRAGAPAAIDAPFDGPAREAGAGAAAMVDVAEGEAKVATGVPQPK